MPKISILGVAFCSVAFVGCSIGSSDTPTPSPDFEKAAQTVAPEVPLTLSEMPEGWEQNPEGDTGLTQSVELRSECNIFDLHVAFPNAFATATGPSLSDSGRQVTTYGAIYRSGDAAQNDVDGTHDIIEACADDYKSAVEKIADEKLSALGIHLGFLASIDVTLVEMSEPTGDGSRSYRLQAKINLPGDDLTFTLDARVVRVGRVVAAITYYTQGEGGTDGERGIAAALVASATEADGALPN